MKYQYLLIVFLLSLCANANAEWFLRGTHNAWAAAQMESAGVGTNTMQLKGVVFTAAGNVKFDRFGDWKESYGVGGLGGTNIAVAAGTWDIKFFTDTKKWSIAAPPVAATYHVRGTNNGWLEGTLMTRAGTTDTYELCVNFTAGDANGGPRFKIDPNGGWGDGIPATDFLVTAGWVKISFNAVSKAITTQQNLAANCGAPTSSSSIANSSSLQSSIVASSSSIKSSIASSSAKSSTTSSSVVSSSSIKSSIVSSSVAPSSAASIYHVRGTFNGWLEGTLMNRIGTTDNYELCVNFVGTNTRFKIDPNGAWGDGIPAADFVVTAGWVKISFNSVSKVIATQQNLAANCAAASSSSVINSSVKSSVASVSVASSAPASIYHVRGTFNGWLEGTLMNRIGTTDNYELCVNFVGTGTRFKVDPNGGWGDGIPASDFIVTPGWVKILFNSATKSISVQQNLTSNCATASSVAAASFATSSVTNSLVTSIPSSIYHVRGTFNGWTEGTFMNRVGTTANYEKCINFPADPTGPHFKIDPDGGWGADVLPSPTTSGISVTEGWVKITLNSTTKAISLQQSLSSDCSAVVTSSLSRFNFEDTNIYLRSSIDGWGEGILMQPEEHTFYYRNTCIQVSGNPKFRITSRDKNGVEGLPHFRRLFADSSFNEEGIFAINSSSIILISYNMLSGDIDVVTDMKPNCPMTYSVDDSTIFTPMTAFPTTIQPSKPFIPIHIRGTHNAWNEGTLMNQIGTTDDYEACLNIPVGDDNGGPRFKLDPNGGWGTDTTPEANVPAGWVKVRYNTTTKEVTKRAYLTEGCNVPVYSLAGTHLTWPGTSGWKPADFFEYIDSDAPSWKICRDFTGSESPDRIRMLIIKDDGKINDSTPASDWSSENIYSTSGWTLVSFTNDYLQPTIVRNLGPHCTAL